MELVALAQELRSTARRRRKRRKRRFNEIAARFTVKTPLHVFTIDDETASSHWREPIGDGKHSGAV